MANPFNLFTRIGDKAGSVGVLISAIGCASCFPALAGLGGRDRSGLSEPVGRPVHHHAAAVICRAGPARQCPRRVQSPAVATRCAWPDRPGPGADSGVFDAGSRLAERLAALYRPGPHVWGVHLGSRVARPPPLLPDVLSDSAKMKE